MWAAISYEGPEQLYFVEGKENTDMYEEILNACLPEIRKLTHEDGLFQQDNAPPHAALMRRGYFESKGIKILDWPRQSPDLSPIENIWGILKNKIFDTADEITSINAL